MVDIKNFGQTIMEYDLVKYEFDFGFSFPREYKEFLKSVNGGIPTPNKFDLSKKEKEGLVLNVLFGVGVEKNYNVFYILKRLKNSLSRSWIPIGEVEGGGLVCLGVEGDKFENIYFWDKKEGERAEDGKNFFLVAENFEGFLNSIYE